MNEDAGAASSQELVTQSRGRESASHGVELLFRWGTKGWQITCSCGWESWSHPFRSAAISEHQAHAARAEA